MSHPLINVTLVTDDARSLSFQEWDGGWKVAIARVLAHQTDGDRIARIFMAENGCGLEEHTFASLREDVAAGRVPA